jgi:hypothetical protein
MPFRFVVWESEPDDAQLGVLSIEILVESLLTAIVQFGRLII